MKNFKIYIKVIKLAFLLGFPLQTSIYGQSGCFNLVLNGNDIDVYFRATSNINNLVSQGSISLSWNQSIGSGAILASASGPLGFNANGFSNTPDDQNSTHYIKKFVKGNGSIISLSSGSSILACSITIEPSNGGTYSLSQEFLNAFIPGQGVRDIFASNAVCNTIISLGPTPVELATFSANKLGDDKVTLDWTTSSEINNDFFQVERSADGKNFELLGIVAGHGNSTEEINYNYIDTKPLYGNNYYRLKQVDFDGAFEYSDIRVVRFEDNFEFKASVFPNPVSENIHISARGLSQENSAIAVELVNTLGQVVKRKTFAGQSDLYIMETDGVSDGQYYVVIRNNGEMLLNEKVVISKK